MEYYYTSPNTKIFVKDLDTFFKAWDDSDSFYMLDELKRDNEIVLTNYHRIEYLHLGMSFCFMNLADICIGILILISHMRKIDYITLKTGIFPLNLFEYSKNLQDLFVKIFTIDKKKIDNPIDSIFVKTYNELVSMVGIAVILHLVYIYKNSEILGIYASDILKIKHIDKIFKYI